MIREFIATLLIAGTAVALAVDELATPLSDGERVELEKIGKGNPPKGKESDFKLLKDENASLKGKLKQLESEASDLEDNKIKLLDGDIDFYKRKIKRLELKRSGIVTSITNARKSVNQFNQALMEYVGERLNKKSYLILGVPAFKRSNVYSQEGAKSLLVINLDYPVSDNLYAVGGEIVTAGTGNAQFVVLHKHDDGTFKVEKAGEAIEITDADKIPEKSIFKKTVLFSDNFAELASSDLWGLVIDADAGLTYDSFDSGHSYVAVYDGSDTIKWANENIQSKNTFSFDLFVQTKDKE